MELAVEAIVFVYVIAFIVDQGILVNHCGAIVEVDHKLSCRKRVA
jgi:hypothetical protein